MRSQTLAVSVVLLLMAVATLPGLSFSLSSSVTSYNNGITVNGSITITGGSDGFYVTNVDESFKNIPNLDGAYEIASGDSSFCGEKFSAEVSFTIPKDKTFIVNAKIDNYYYIDRSGFQIKISYTDTESNSITVETGKLHGDQVKNDDGSAQGYLIQKNGVWQLNKQTAFQFGPANSDITVTVNGTEYRSDIHLYIILIKDEEAKN